MGEYQNPNWLTYSNLIICILTLQKQIQSQTGLSSECREVVQPLPIGGYQEAEVPHWHSAISAAETQTAHAMVAASLNLCKQEPSSFTPVIQGTNWWEQSWGSAKAMDDGHRNYRSVSVSCSLVP